MGHTGRWIFLIVLVLAAAAGGLFTVQNGERISTLTLDLWIVAYQLKEPLPIPYMLWAAFGGGLVIAGSWGTFQRLGLQRRVRDLEQEVARNSLRAQDDDWT